MINGFADPRRRESQSAVRSESPQQLIVRSACMRCAHRKLRRLTSVAFEAIASFLCGGTFLRLLSPRKDPDHHTRAAGGSSSICQTKQRRTQFVAKILIAGGIDRCADAAAAEMPFASPYCLYRAQNRRVRVQSRTRLAVSSSMRARSHASRLARAHHFTIPKIRGGRL
jgi:hypothetical protein